MNEITKEERASLENEIKAQVSDVLPLVQDEISTNFAEQSQKKQEADLAWKDFLPSLVATMKSKGSFQELASDEFGEDIISEVVQNEISVKNKNFRFAMKSKQLIIILDIIKLEKHFVYYLIDLLENIKKHLD